jgi:hypothetical protein
MQKLKKIYSLIFRVLLKYFVSIKKYSRGAGGQVFRNLWTTHGKQYRYILCITSL